MPEPPSVILSGFADEAANQKTAVQQFAAFAALGLQYYSLRFVDVGGGVKNETLNRMTQELTGREVLRGPSESTAIGNIAVQIAALEKTKSLDQIQAISARLKFPA